MPERLEDFALVKDKKDFREMISKVFTFINKEETIRAKRDTTYQPKNFDSHNAEDIQYYLLEYLPREIAKNMAKLHNLGLIHHFPHYGNISAAGGIYDLDSVKGEALEIGDAAVTDQDIYQDVYTLINGTILTTGRNDGLRQFVREIQTLGHLPPETYCEEQFFNQFHQEYISQRGWDNNILHNLPQIYEYIGLFQGVHTSPNLLMSYYQKVSEQLGWHYLEPEDLESLYNKYLNEQYNLYQQRFDRTKYGEKPDERKTATLPQNRLRNLVKDDAVFRILEQEVREQFPSEIDSLEKNYSKEHADVVVYLNVISMHNFVESEVLERLDNGFVSENDYYLEQIKKEGWDKDIVWNIGKIFYLFNDFREFGDDIYKTYFLSCLKEQIGISFEFNDSNVEATFANYLEHIQKEFIKVLVPVHLELKEGADREKAFLNAYKNAGYEHTTEFSYDLWVPFLDSYLADKIEEQVGKKLEAAIADRFPTDDDFIEAALPICGLLSKEAESALEKALTKEKEKELAHQERKMEIRMLSLFVHHPEIVEEMIREVEKR